MADLAEYVMTVLGPVDPGSLGLTSCHEHVLMDMRGWPSARASPAEQAFAALPVSIENLGALRRDTWSLNADNYVLADEAVAEDELDRFKRAGGGTIVDLTCEGLEPRPAALRALASRTGLNIVAGCGYYVASMLRPATSRASLDDLAESMAFAVTNGLDGTDVRPGIIGEIGTSERIEAVERTVLLAAAAVHKQTGLAINVHTYPWARNGLEVSSLLLGAGVPGSKIVISHLDNAPLDLDYHRQLGRLGVFMEYDGFGKEWYVDSKGSWFPRDYERIGGLRELIDGGFLDQLLLGCDVCLKIQLVRFGGWGYEHLPRHVVPLMRRLGLSSSEIETMLVANPRRLLTIRPQQS